MSRALNVSALIRSMNHPADVADTVNVAMRALGEPEVPADATASVYHVWADSTSNPEARHILVNAERRVTELAK